jgi:hypothetical protein
VLTAAAGSACLQSVRFSFERPYFASEVFFILPSIYVFERSNSTILFSWPKSVRTLFESQFYRSWCSSYKREAQQYGLSFVISAGFNPSISHKAEFSRIIRTVLYSEYGYMEREAICNLAGLMPFTDRPFIARNLSFFKRSGHDRATCSAPISPGDIHS